MDFIKIKRDKTKTPKDALLELYDNNKGKIFIVMMSEEWFKELKKCDGVEKDMYDLNPPNYDAYFINESRLISAKCLLKIEVKFVAKSVIIINTSKSSNPYKDEDLETIFYFE